MNIVDYALIAVIGISLLWGLYRGFISSLLNVGAALLSFLGSFLIYPSIANSIQSNQNIVMNLIHYTDAGSRIGDLELSLTKVASLGQSGLETVLQNANLPFPFNELLSYNITNQIYATIGAATVEDYIKQTIVTASINVLCFLLCFIVLYLIFSIVINLLRAVFNFPMLKHFDTLLGGAFGFVRGILFCYLIFTLVPLASTIIHVDQFDQLISSSLLATVFNNGNLILSILNRKL